MKLPPSLFMTPPLLLSRPNRALLSSPRRSRSQRSTVSPWSPSVRAYNNSSQRALYTLLVPWGEIAPLGAQPHPVSPSVLRVLQVRKGSQTGIFVVLSWLQSLSCCHDDSENDDFVFGIKFVCVLSFFCPNPHKLMHCWMVMNIYVYKKMCSEIKVLNIFVLLHGMRH